jgi:hypothetical protein
MASIHRPLAAATTALILGITAAPSAHANPTTAGEQRVASNSARRLTGQTVPSDSGVTTTLYDRIPTPVAPGEAMTIGIGLSSETSAAPGSELQVTRYDAAHPDGVALPNIQQSPVNINWFPLADTAPTSGPLSYHVYYPGDADHEPASLTITVPVAKYAPTISELSVPGSAQRGAQLNIGGLLIWPHAHLETGSLHVTRTDMEHPHGYALGTVEVSATGFFSIHDTPTIGGPNTYTFTYDGGSAYLSVSASGTVEVSRAATSVSVTTDASTYNYGAWAHVTAHLGTTYNSRQVTLYAQPYGGSKTAITTGSTDAHGDLSAWYRIGHNTTFTAAFAGDDRYNPVSATHTAWDRAQVNSTMVLNLESETIDGSRYAVYVRDAPSLPPLFRTTVSPDHTGQCLTTVLQRYYSGSWHTVTANHCALLGSYSVYQGYLPWNTMPDNALYRIIAEYTHNNADNTSLDNWGTWQYFTIHANPS